MSYSKPSPYFFFILSFWYRLILISAVQRMLFKWSGFFRCFLAKSNLALFASCGEPSVFVLVKSSLDCRLLTVTRLSPGECSSLGWMLWKGFLYHGERILRSSTTVVLPWTSRPFYVAELTSAFFFFSECTKLLIWPLLMFLLSLWWICFVFEA